MSVTETTPLPLDPTPLREDFPILATSIHGDKPLIYLDNAATTQRPRAVIQALVETYEKHYANVHRGIHWLSDQSTDLYEDSRQKIQAFIGAQKALKAMTIAAINMAANSLDGMKDGMS